MNKPEEKPAVPRLSPEIKDLNGASGKKLSQCIDTLCELLDEDVKQSSSDKKIA